MVTTAIPLVDLLRQHQLIKGQVLAGLARIIEESAFVLGEEVASFEAAFADYCQARHAVGVGSGTEALTLALLALGVGEGDEVVTAANTFVATAEAILHAGARPVLVDIDPHSRNMDPDRLEERITPRTRAIIPVHLYGNPADMASVLAIARRHRLLVVEDAAQAHGALYRDKPVGALGDAGCFSFYPSKNLGAMGDGGAVVTNSDEVALRVRELRDHGATKGYRHLRPGFTSRLDAVQAAVLGLKLPYLNDWNAERRRIAARYRHLLSNVPGLVVPQESTDGTHVYHLYVVRLPAGRRTLIQRFLGARGIATGIHYPEPIHLTEAFAFLGYRAGEFPVAEQLAGEILSLPMYPGLEEGQVDYISQALVEALESEERK